jgi:predicted porin
MRSSDHSRVPQRQETALENKIIRAHGLCVAGALTALASLAQAQTSSTPAPAPSPAAAPATSSVTVYGLMDMYVERRTNMSPEGGDRWMVNSGGMNTSRLGFRGTEDLGGGLKALFQLESEVVMDTGGSNTSAFWGRQAWVGMEGALGRLQAGRSFSSTYDFVIAFDPMGYAPNYSWATSAGAAGARKDGMVTGVSNMLKYRVALGPVTLGAMLAPSEGNGSKVYGLAGNYSAGPFAMVATWERIELATTGDETQTVHVAASLALGDAVKLFAAIRDYDKQYTIGGATGSHEESRTWWLGANYLPIPALTLTAVYYAQNIRARTSAGGIDDPSMLVMRARYALSKRTDLHLTLGHAESDGAPVSLSRDDLGYGGTQSGVTVGIQHRF